MTMIKKFKILGKFIKDLSSETRDIETYLFVKEYIGKYQLNIEISSKPIKNTQSHFLGECGSERHFFQAKNIRTALTRFLYLSQSSGSG